MMKNLCAVSFLVASLYAGNVYAQPAAVKKIVEIGTTDNRVSNTSFIPNRQKSPSSV